MRNINAFVIREKKKPRGRGAIAGLLWFLFGETMMGGKSHQAY
jgi:hypothetical protein